MTYTLIDYHQVESATESSIIFENIANTYLDLRVWISARADSLDNAASLHMKINGSTDNIVTGFIYKEGTSLYTASRSNDHIGYINAANSDSDNFATVDISIGDYSSSNVKMMHATSHATNHGSSSVPIIAEFYRRDVISLAVSSLEFYCPSGNFVQNSTISLYGIASGSDGITIVS